LLFHTPQYGFFLVLIVMLFWLLRRNTAMRIGVLWVASYFFYACWNFWYLWLIFATSAVDYTVGWLLSRQENTRKRKLILAWSIVFNLGVLAIFKYFNFFSAGTGWLAALLGLRITMPTLDILLPVGISFYTFQSMSYTIDVYRRKIEPARNLAEFCLFVSFFPQLVAGPIVRASDLLHQFRKDPVLDDRQAMEGVYRIGVGLLKKVILADFLAVSLIDGVFAHPEANSTARLWITLVGYSFQLYGDFSGYSDIAIGSAALMGFRIPENFNRPYLARSMREFWERWHISLSTWLRDYLYFVIGGSRGSASRTYVNLFLTMFLVGLWHGAAWNFVVWGIYIATVMVVTRGVHVWAESRKLALAPNGLASWLLRVGFFFTLALSWPIFRAKTSGDMMAYYHGLFAGGGRLHHIGVFPLVVIVLGIACHVLPVDWELRVRNRLSSLPAPAAAVIFVMLLVFLSRAAAEAQPFIYFQF